MSDDRLVLELPEVDAAPTRDAVEAPRTDDVLARIVGSTARAHVRDVLGLEVESGGE